MTTPEFVTTETGRPDLFSDGDAARAVVLAAQFVTRVDALEAAVLAEDPQAASAVVLDAVQATQETP